MKRLTLLLSIATLLGLPGPAAEAAPLGTAFNYQGRLDQNGQPATGLYQMTFWLYAASGGGSPLASNTVPSVPVTNGLFVADVDFGTAAFTGDERWLGMTVRTNNGALPFILLTSRTRIAPTPHAVYAGTAGTATNVVNGAVVKSLNGLRDAVSLVAGPNITLTPSGNSLTVASTGGPGVWSLNGASAYYNGGNVGIGTTTPSTYGHGGTAKILEVNNSGTTINSQAHLMLYSGVNSLFDSSIGTVTWAQPGGMAAYIGALTRSTTPNAPAAALAFGTRKIGDAAASPKMVITEEGNVGIGTSDPQDKLDVNGGVIANGNLQVRGFGAIELGSSLGNGNTPYIDFHYGVGGDQDWNVRLINDVDRRLTMDANFLRVNGAASEQAYIGADGAGGDVQVGSFNPGVTTVSLYNAGNNTYMNLVARDVSTRVLTITGGADLAEPFPMKEEAIEKGSVVVIDEEHPGRLKMSTRAYDTQVAGIVSGANGINPGISLKQEGVLDQGQNVSLTGRVYVKADATHGAIKPGDLITTSDTPGHAMKVGDPTKSQGAILGKAMSALKEGTGLVLVLVTLQ